MKKEHLVQNIKDCGEAIFNNAEKIAGDLPLYSRDLSLTCYPSEVDQAIYINVNYDFIPERYISRGGKIIENEERENA